MDDTSMTSPVGETFGKITSWRDFEDRFKAAMAMAAAQPADITLMDADFNQWPLGQRSVMEAFHQWSLASRSSHCRVLAAHFDGFLLRHPLWVTWRTTWSHRVQCFQASQDMASALCPVLILHGTIGLRLNEPVHGAGMWTRDPGRLAEWLSEIDVILQRSEPAMPPTTLGL